MMDTHFIHEISQLDSIRQKMQSDPENALRVAASQFEALFTQLLFKSMRDANKAFESNLLTGRTTKLYQQLADEQLASNLSKQGSLGLTELILEQYKALYNKPKNTEQNQFIISNKKIDKTEFASPNDFVSKLLPMAKKAARALGVDPLILLAQSALETGWGKKVIKEKQSSTHNLFNIKTSNQWTGNKASTQSAEFYDGVWIKKKSEFRGYASFEESFDDYIHFLTSNPRYQKALNSVENPKDFIDELQQAGFATDPLYAKKVMQIFKQIKTMTN